MASKVVLACTGTLKNTVLHQLISGPIEARQNVKLGNVRFCVFAVHCLTQQKADISPLHSVT